MFSETILIIIDSFLHPKARRMAISAVRCLNLLWVIDNRFMAGTISSIRNIINICRLYVLTSGSWELP